MNVNDCVHVHVCTFSILYVLMSYPVRNYSFGDMCSYSTHHGSFCPKEWTEMESYCTECGEGERKEDQKRQPSPLSKSLPSSLGC